MIKNLFPVAVLISLQPAFAEDTRELDAHEHGVGHLNIAVEGTNIAIEFNAPGADIVGFEHPAESEDDQKAIEDAKVVLAKPLDIFVIPTAAQCTVGDTHVDLESEHDEHHDKEHDHDETEHDDHAEEGHDHDDHADAESHTEFHAEYAITCSTPDALDQIDFAYFTKFPNAQKITVQAASAKGAERFEVTRENPVLDLSSIF